MHSLKSIRSWPHPLLWVILIAGLFVRIWGVWRYAYNGDELQYIIIAKGATLQEVWNRGLIETHPPLLHFLRHYFLMLTSDPFANRLLSIFAGTISILAVYQIGVLLRDHALGIFCSLYIALAPVAVSVSMQVRGYALFTAILFGALYFFISYQRKHTWSDLTLFTILIFLASALHFSGFLVAATCGICEGFTLLKAQRWKLLFSFGGSFIPLLILGLLFYFNFMAHGTPGDMWHQVFVNYGASSNNLLARLYGTLTNIYYFFVPLGGIRNIPSEGMPARIVLFLMLAGSIYLIALQAMALHFMYGRARDMFYLILVLWAVAIIASLMSFYPFQPLRQSIYLLPAFIIPLGYLAERSTHRILLSPSATRWTALCIICAALLLSESGTYINFANELPLQQNDLQAGQGYLAKQLKSGDTIITGGGPAYFYLLYEKDAGKTAYNSYSDFTYLPGITAISIFDPPSKKPENWKSYQDQLKSKLNNYTANPDTKFWIVFYGWIHADRLHLMECSTIKQNMRDFFSRKGVIIFSIKKAIFLDFVKNDDAWERCYANYQSGFVPVPFKVNPL